MESLENSGANAARSNELLNARLAHTHQGKLGRGKEGVSRNQEKDQQEADVNGNTNGRKKRRKRIIIISVVVIVLVLIVGVAVAFSHGSSKIDPSKLGSVERHDLAKSVVATGKVEPITKVEVKSKA